MAVMDDTLSRRGKRTGDAKW